MTELVNINQSFFNRNIIDLGKTACHRPCLLKDGRIRTLTKDFKNQQELNEFVRHTTDYDPYLYHHAEWYWLLSCDAMKEVEGIVVDAYTHSNKGEVQLAYKLKGDDDFKHVPIEFNLEQCPSCINDDDINRSVLTDARPDLSVFVSRYPLHPHHAKSLRLLLSNIEYVDCRKLFVALRPFIVEAATCGLSIKHRDEMLAEVDSLIDSITDDYISVTTSLPTVKEVLSAPKVDLSWE